MRAPGVWWLGSRKGEILSETGTVFKRGRGRRGLSDGRLRAGAGGEPIKAFVNVGGSYVDMGTDGEVLKLRPGFNPAGEVIVPPAERRGLIQEMALRGIPVIHLLYVKGLCDRYGLPWDPFPLPGPAAPDSVRRRFPRPAFLIVYLAGTIIGLAWLARSRSRFGK